jgi:hypothetical protein
VEEIGGFEHFARALSVIHLNDFYMGRLPPKPGKKPFRLHIGFLLSQGDSCGDVLAGLVDVALDAGSGDDDIEARVRDLVESKIGADMIGDMGRERALQELRRIAEEKLARSAAA